MSEADRTPQRSDLFRLFNEIGIIQQLSSTAFERVLPHGLTQAQFTLLNHLSRIGNGWPPARIATALQVSRGTLTSTIKRLEHKAFVRLDDNPEDGRSKYVFLTEAGEAALARSIQAAAPLLTRTNDMLTPQEIATVLPVLERLRQWLDENR
ncbi:MAG: MarR family transcriptional regulator [Pseudomonadota bacterium]